MGEFLDTGNGVFFRLPQCQSQLTRSCIQLNTNCNLKHDIDCMLEERAVVGAIKRIMLTPKGVLSSLLLLVRTTHQTWST